MLTVSVNHILHRWLVSLSGVLLGLSAAILLLLWLANAPHSAQAADSPHPLTKEPRANADWRAAAKDQPAQGGGITPASLTSTPAQTLTGEIADSDFGYPVATAGDVNGDGYADVIVGAYLYNNTTGRAYLYLGSANGLSATPAFTTTGEGPVNAFGFAAATAGDINGDGYADVIIGANAYSNSNGRGRIYLYIGSATGLNITPALTVTGEPGSDFGVSAGTAGDVNGDGYADVIVGAPNSPAGHAYLYVGSANGLSATPAFTGTSDASGYGFLVGTAGDVNGDGYADVIVGESRSNDSGRAYLYLGSVSGLNAAPAITLTGEANSGYPWRSVGTAGDVNGDGYADVIVGASPVYSRTGQAYVYLGSASGLSATPTFTATGEAVNDELGFSAATSGDVNGDGYADIIIGAWGHYSSTGRAYVYLGSASGLNTTPTITVTGEMTNTELGISVGTAGDVNGDGYADFIVGAIGYNNYTGRAYVYHGAADLPGSTPVFTATGDANYTYLGQISQIATVGDVNGDGHADIAIGEPFYLSYTGRVRLYTGTTVGLSAAPALTITGNMTNSFFGNTRTAGDVNGDGYDDIIFSAYAHNTNHSGQVYLYLGSPSGLSPSPTLTATSEMTDDAYGFSGGRAGDVNGDGYADVIVGAYQSNNYTGRVYVYLGSAGGLNSAPAFTFTGEATIDMFGLSAATAGDVNGDGYADVIVGAPGYGDLIGQVYVYTGSANGLNTTPAFTSTGETSNSRFGWSVGTAGDVNGDGYSDVIIGADIYFSDTGRVYVYTGSASGLSPTPAFTATGETTDDGFGVSAATAGDVNGDGFADVIVGAYLYKNGSRVGRTYIYFGSAMGLSTRSVLTLTGEARSDFGYQVGTAGDTNGDGYADIAVAGPIYSETLGRVYLFSGNGNYGLSLIPRQRRADNSAPIAQGGRSDSESAFRIAALGYSPFGRGKVKLEWEVKPLGTPLDGTGTHQSATWMDSGTAGAAFDELVTGLSANTVYHWRVRILYHPATTPFQQYSRWFTQPWNGWQEADFRTATGAPLKLYLPLVVR